MKARGANRERSKVFKRERINLIGVQLGLEILTAFLLSDGGVSPRGKKSWTIYFRNKDERVLKKFIKILHMLTKITPAIQKRKDSTAIAKFHSRRIGNKLLELTPSFRTTACEVYPPCPYLYGKRKSCKKCSPLILNSERYPPAKIPAIFFHSRKKAKEFLRIYATCDGGVSVAVGKKGKQRFLVRKIFVSVKHPKLKKNLERLFKSLCFNPKSYEGQIRLTTKADIEKFAKEVRFLKGSLISADSKIWRGKEKNFVLGEIIKSYENPKPLIEFIISSSGLNRD